MIATISMNMEPTPLKTQSENQPETQLQTAVRLLSEGQNIGLPTETVFGLAGSIRSQRALESIFSLKERPFFDPLIVHISNLSQLEEVVGEWNPLAQILATRFWPGPLTLVVKKKDSLNSLITSGLETVAVRMPSHPQALEVIDRLGHPLAAPSANKFGKTSPTRSEHVSESFPELFVLESGPSQWGLESTVVQIEDGQTFLLRPGAVTAEELNLELEKHGYSKTQVSEKVNSPGHLKHHYQPEKPLFVLRTKKDIPRAAVSELTDFKMKGCEVSLSRDPVKAARELYSELRLKSRSEGDYLYLVWLNDQSGDLWEAIWDRVKRAATTTIDV
jgi:L-threonylcarbamoyladenylate synthase